MSDNLAELASESGGHLAEASVKAARKESLDKNRGIVGIIVESLRRSTTNLKDFRVIGRPMGSSKEVTISSVRHQERTFVDVDPKAPPHESDSDVFEAGRELIGQRSRRMQNLRDTQ
ncbi:hypothetical protein [Oerskovia enterophila]|uniref:hypothetical protein n=1 Tax=Oerskovia enterophila TaxID=43678 RepID=UPI0033926660